MKVTYGWLKDFVEIKMAPEQLADKLTMAGLEVTSLEKIDGDYIFEIEITSNRPDWLSVIGIAREVAAITGEKLKRLPEHQSTRAPVRNEGQYVIEIENKQDCPLYTAKIIRNVKVGPSPEWLRKRLELVGCRSVNNVVDITNYVLFELGEPLHAFDADTLAQDKIIVRRAKNQEKLLGIDAEERILSPDILIIADAEKPIAIAGVMGGKHTEVSQDSKNVLLEAAIFNPVVVRRGRQKMGLQSEASYRFERGIDGNIVETASLRTVALIRELCQGDLVAAKRVGSVSFQDRRIDLEAESVEKILGVKISLARIKKILTDLGFKVKAKRKSGFTVNIPSHRQDVKAPIDLIEEIARIFGFDNTPTTLPAVMLQVQDSDTNKPLALIKNILTGLGLNEVITYSLVDRKSLDGFGGEENNLLEISNPLSQEQEVLRSHLSPSLAKCVAYNLRQQQPYINIFEIAKTYLRSENKIQEEYVLGIALCGTKSRWFGPQQPDLQDEAGFLHLKGILASLFQRLGIDEKDMKFVFRENGYEVDVLIKDTKIGLLRRLQKELLDRFDIKHKEVFAAEIALGEKLLPLIHIEKKFRPNLVGRYPGIARDVTLELERAVPFKDIKATITGLHESLLQEIGFKDYYAGQKVPAGFKRITISLRYYSAERTLTEAEINLLHDKVVAVLKEKLHAQIR
jgi:phenylalanyl-tRNA synthetase beta chain